LLETVKSDDKLGDKLAAINHEKAVNKINRRMEDPSYTASIDSIKSTPQQPEAPKKKLNPSTSECQIVIRELRDDYRKLVTQLNGMREDNLSYFHQEFLKI